MGRMDLCMDAFVGGRTIGWSKTFYSFNLSHCRSEFVLSDPKLVSSLS